MNNSVTSTNAGATRKIDQGEASQEHCLLRLVDRPMCFWFAVAM